MKRLIVLLLAVVMLTGCIGPIRENTTSVPNLADGYNEYKDWSKLLKGPQPWNFP